MQESILRDPGTAISRGGNNLCLTQGLTAAIPGQVRGRSPAAVSPSRRLCSDEASMVMSARGHEEQHFMAGYASKYGPDTAYYEPEAVPAPCQSSAPALRARARPIRKMKLQRSSHSACVPTSGIPRPKPKAVRTRGGG